MERRERFRGARYLCPNRLRGELPRHIFMGATQIAVMKYKSDL